MTTLQTQLRNHVDECHASMGQLWVAKLFTEAANRIDALESAIEEQTRTIGALNMCIGGRDSTSTENVIMADALAAGDGCLHALIDDLRAHNLALLADVKDCQQQSRDYQAENAVIKSQMAELDAIACADRHIAETAQASSARLQKQVSALSKALDGFIANSCRVDWPADIYDAAIAAQKDTV